MLHIVRLDGEIFSCRMFDARAEPVDWDDPGFANIGDVVVGLVEIVIVRILGVRL